SLEEIIDVGRRSGCKLHISHLKATGRGSVAQMRRALELIDNARAQGADVTFDVYPYAAGSTSLEAAVRADANREPGPPSNVQPASVPGAPELSGRWLRALAD